MQRSGEDIYNGVIQDGNNIISFLRKTRGRVFTFDFFRYLVKNEDLTPFLFTENVIAMLNQFFDIVVDIVFRNNGILDKFVGDQLMAVFGIISPDSSAPYDAVKTALETQDASEDLMNLRRKQDKETFKIGIGINTGSAIVGNVGSENRMDYTVIGDTVNVAGRLQQMAKGGEIVIGEQTYAQIKGRFHIEKKLKIKVKNKTEPVICYKVKR